MTVAGEIADVVDPHIEDPRVDRPPQEALPERALEDTGEDREDVDTHAARLAVASQAMVTWVAEAFPIGRRDLSAANIPLPMERVATREPRIRRPVVRALLAISAARTRSSICALAISLVSISGTSASSDTRTVELVAAPADDGRHISPSHPSRV